MVQSVNINNSWKGELKDAINVVVPEEGGTLDVIFSKNIHKVKDKSYYKMFFRYSITQDSDISTIIYYQISLFLNTSKGLNSLKIIPTESNGALNKVDSYNVLTTMLPLCFSLDLISDSMKCYSTKTSGEVLPFHMALIPVELVENNLIVISFKTNNNTGKIKIRLDPQISINNDTSSLFKFSWQNYFLAYINHSWNEKFINNQVHKLYENEFSLDTFESYINGSVSWNTKVKKKSIKNLFENKFYLDDLSKKLIIEESMDLNESNKNASTFNLVNPNGGSLDEFYSIKENDEQTVISNNQYDFGLDIKTYFDKKTLKVVEDKNGVDGIKLNPVQENNVGVKRILNFDNFNVEICQEYENNSQYNYLIEYRAVKDNLDLNLENVEVYKWNIDEINMVDFSKKEEVEDFINEHKK